MTSLGDCTARRAGVRCYVTTALRQSTGLTTRLTLAALVLASMAHQAAAQDQPAAEPAPAEPAPAQQEPQAPASAEPEAPEAPAEPSELDTPAAAPDEAEPQPEPVVEPPAADIPAPEEVAEAAPIEETDPNEILVTAQFRKQNPQKTPLSITAVSGEMLQERSQTNIAEVANQAPNVRLSPGAGAFGPALQAHIRGVGQNDFNFALEPGVGMYVDDVYYSTLIGSLLDLLDLDRVEILRGPQGTLAGQNSIGGAIKLYSTLPKGDNSGYLQTTYGSFNRVEVRGGGDFSLIKDRLFGRISGVAKHSDGYVNRYDYRCTHPNSMVPSFQDSESCKLGTEGGQAYAGTRLSLRWLPVERLDVNVIGDYTHDNSQSVPNTLLYVGSPMGPGVPNSMMTMMPPPNGMINGVLLGGPTGSDFISYSPFGNYALDTYSHSPYVNYSTYTDPSPVDGTAPFSVPPMYRVNSGGASGKIVYDVTDNVSLTSISAYRKYNGDWSVDEGTPVNIYLLHNVVSHHQFTQELRLNLALLDEAIHVTVGGFYLNTKSHYGGRISLRTAQFLEDDDITAWTAAGFGNAEWRIIDGLSLIAGVRATKQKKDFTYGRAQVPGANANMMLTSLDGTVGTYDGDLQLDYRAAIQYQVIPQLLAYVQTSTGFKGGGVNPRPFFVDQAKSHKPEKLTAYEVGVKTDWLNKRLRVNVAGFFNQYRDILMTVSMCPDGSTPVPCAMPINAGTANVMGAELEALINPVAGLSVDGSLSLLNFKYQSISMSGQSSGIMLDMKGPFVPEYAGSLGARYDFVLGSSGTLTPRLDLSFRGAYYTSPTNSEFSQVDSHVLLNGRLIWLSKDELWQAALEVTNITDQVYYYNVRDDRGSSYTVQGQIAPPRQWGFTVRRNFF